MTSLHKEICSFLLESVEKSLEDTEIIKTLTQKSQQLLNRLLQFKQQHQDGNYGKISQNSINKLFLIDFNNFQQNKVDMKTLEAAKLPANVDRFLYNFAAAEGLTKL